MTTSRLLKFFVVLFSLAAGGVLTWQLSRNLMGKPVLGDAQQEEQSVEDVDAKAEPPKPMAFSSKRLSFNPEAMNGSDDAVVNRNSIDEILDGNAPNIEESESKQEVARPLLPGSKMGLVLDVDLVEIPGIPKADKGKEAESDSAEEKE